MTEALYVCIPHTLRDYFDYLDNGLKPAMGARVRVPFRKKTKIGIVVGKGVSQLKAEQLKPIAEVLDDTPLLSAVLLKLCHWVSEYYQSPLSEVLPLAIPKTYREGAPQSLPQTTRFEVLMPLEEALLKVQKRAKNQIDLLQWLSHRQATASELVQAGFTRATLKTLIKAHLLTAQDTLDIPPCAPTQTKPLVLNEEQAHALKPMQQALGRYQCFLLQGITGSGKTEVYLQLIAHCLEKGQQILVLVPEIGLTPQLLSRFHARFAAPMTVLHSALGERERQHAWQLAKEGHVKLVIGTRTAVFTPMPQLGLIIIDEEHDASLKQNEGVRYSARETALMRAYQADIPIVLGTATPSLETLYNGLNHKYTRLCLNQRAEAAKPLRMTLSDLRAVPLKHGLAESTLVCIEAHLNQGNQVLVFINRRGYAPIMLCHQCGWMADCNACDSHMTLHSAKKQLICHHCGLVKRLPLRCERCKSAELLPVGSGTERIEIYLSERFKQTSVLRIDRDEIQSKQALEQKLERIHQGDAQIIVGTQMLAKGHHFPRLTLAVIVDVDAGFYNQDFRALERLGQLLTQVAGRAGRASLPGEVILQTHQPQHPLLNLLVQQGYEPFAQALLQSRQEALLPPFHHLALLRVKDRHIPKMLAFLNAAKEMLRPHNLSVMGPAPAPLARKAHFHYMQLLIKASTRKNLQQALTALRQWLALNKTHAGMRWNIDVDPQDLS